MNSLVQDVDGDDVRCRWASGYSECGGVCQTFTAVLNMVKIMAVMQFIMTL